MMDTKADMSCGEIDENEPTFDVRPLDVFRAELAARRAVRPFTADEIQAAIDHALSLYPPVTVANQSARDGLIQQLVRNTVRAPAADGER
jgi:hypothetical protein